MAQGRTQNLYFTGFWHFTEFCTFCNSLRMIFWSTAETGFASNSWESVAVGRQASAMFPHQLETRDIALKAVCCLGSLKAHGGKLLPEVLDFYAEFFQPWVLHVFLWVQVCATAVLVCFFFFLQWYLFWGENAFLKMKLNKVSYKRRHLFSILRHFLFLLLSLFSFTLPFWLLHYFWRIDNHCKEKNVLFIQCP